MPWWGFSGHRMRGGAHSTMSLSARFLALALLAIAALAAPACAPNPAPLTREALANATYRVLDEHTVTLADGEYDAYPTRLHVTLLDSMAFGDLDGDSLEDAAVLLATNTGGSGVFVELAAVVASADGPRHVASAPLGDRVRPESIAVDGGDIVVALTGHGPDDAMCCPTQRRKERYRLADGELTMVSRVIEREEK